MLGLGSLDRFVRWCYNVECSVHIVNRDVNAALNMLRLYAWLLARLWAGTLDASPASRPPGLRRR